MRVYHYIACMDDVVQLAIAICMPFLLYADVLCMFMPLCMCVPVCVCVRVYMCLCVYLCVLCVCLSVCYDQQTGHINQLRFSQVALWVLTSSMRHCHSFCGALVPPHRNIPSVCICVHVYVLVCLCTCFIYLTKVKYSVCTLTVDVLLSLIDQDGMDYYCHVTSVTRQLSLQMYSKQVEGCLLHCIIINKYSQTRSIVVCQLLVTGFDKTGLHIYNSKIIT